MSYNKSNIVRNIAIKTSISNKSAKQLLDYFIQVVVHSSLKSQVKISGLGTFNRKISPSRIGRNPKTGEEFIIPEKIKLNLVVSNKIKKKIN